MASRQSKRKCNFRFCKQSKSQLHIFSPKPMTEPRRTPAGLTLVELLVAFAILTFLVVLLASLVSGVNRAWTAGEQQVSEFQDGRAILELIGREVSQATISPALQ